MDNQLILIADADAKNLQILKDNLEAAGFLVSTVTNGKDAWEEILRTSPKLILSETNLPSLSGHELLERINSDIKTASIPVIFLTKQREIQQRIKGFELGVKDYLIKPVHVKEVIAHIRMVLRRIEQRKTDQLESARKFSGRLDQLNLADLIESFGIERKTGILTVSNGKRTGQVFFREGAVVNATLGDFKSEQAVYQMLPWESGYFTMIFRDIDVADKISISNLGLLLQGIKRLEVREKLFAQLPSPKTAFTISPTFKVLVDKKKVGNGASNFVALLDGEKNVEQILDESRLDDLVALNRLVRLYQQGFIKPTIAVKAQATLQADLIKPEEKITFITKHETPQEIVFEQPKKTVEYASAEADKRNESQITRHSEPISGYDTTNEKAFSLPVEGENQGLTGLFNEDISPFASALEAEVQNNDALATPHAQFPEFEEENIFALEPSIKQERLEKDSEDPFLLRVQEPEIPAPIFPIKQKNEAAVENLKTDQAALLTDEKNEDNVFQIRPKKSPQDLESELKPIIESIANARKESVADESIIEAAVPEIDKKAEIAETEFISTILPSYSKELEEKNIEFADLRYIDEELLKQSSLKLKQESRQSEDLSSKSETKIKIDRQSQKDIAFTPPAKKDKIILISIDDDCKDEMMDILTNDNFKSLQISQADNFKIDVGKIFDRKFSHIKLISAPIEKNLNAFFKSIKTNLAGTIFAFDCSRPETWEYTRYLIHSLWFKYRIPYIVAVMKFDEQNSITLDVIRYQLDLSNYVNMIIWDEDDKSMAEKLLQAVLSSTPPAPHKIAAVSEDSPNH